MTAEDRIRQLFGEGIAFLDERSFGRAEQSFKEILTVKPQSVPTLTNLAIAQWEQRKHRDAEFTAQQVLKLDDQNIQAQEIIAACLKARNEFESAARICEKILSHQPKNVSALNNLGLCLEQMGHADQAIAKYEAAIAIAPGFVEPSLNLGRVYRLRKKYDEAISVFQAAISLAPSSPLGWFGSANVMFDTHRYSEASAGYEQALRYNEAFHDAWVGLGNSLSRLRRFDEAIAAYQKAISINPNVAEAWSGAGNVYYELKSYEDSAAHFDRALSLMPNLPAAWVGKGNIAYDQKDYDGALKHYDHALSIRSDFAEAWFGQANVFTDTRRFDDALTALNKAIEFDSTLLGLRGSRLHMKLLLCNWDNIDLDVRDLRRSIHHGQPSTHPFPLLSVASTSAEQLRCAQNWINHTVPSARNSSPPTAYCHSKIRLAYVSADFRNHPVSQLSVGVFEKHDRTRFEVMGISIGPVDESDMRRRLERAFDKFIEARNLSDREVANIIRNLEVDILIDLTGHTKDARPQILALRPAPIQICYLGYAGTSGADFMDYILADKIVIKPGEERFYSEKIIALPDCFMPHDDVGRRISNKPLARLEHKLPDASMVFCCFNNEFKFNPDVLSRFLTILKSIDDSVLWLSRMNPTARANVQRFCGMNGVDASRLIFADRVESSAEHLARHRLADLFLDTLPYNAHATASDALWAGLPVLTQEGQTFAGRVAASLLNALDLPELVARSSKEFETLAIELAQNKERLTQLRLKLQKKIVTTPVFDVVRFTRSLEGAYEAVQRRCVQGMLPSHITL